MIKPGATRTCVCSTKWMGIWKCRQDHLWCSLPQLLGQKGLLQRWANILKITHGLFIGGKERAIHWWQHSVSIIRLSWTKRVGAGKWRAANYLVDICYWNKTFLPLWCHWHEAPFLHLGPDSRCCALGREPNEDQSTEEEWRFLKQHDSLSAPLTMVF